MLRIVKMATDHTSLTDPVFLLMWTLSAVIVENVYLVDPLSANYAGYVVAMTWAHVLWG